MPMELGVAVEEGQKETPGRPGPRALPVLLEALEPLERQVLDQRVPQVLPDRLVLPAQREAGQRELLDRLVPQGQPVLPDLKLMR